MNRTFKNIQNRFQLFFKQQFLISDYANTFSVDPLIQVRLVIKVLFIWFWTEGNVLLGLIDKGKHINSIEVETEMNEKLYRNAMINKT